MSWAYCAPKSTTRTRSCSVVTGCLSRRGGWLRRTSGGSDSLSSGRSRRARRSPEAGQTQIARRSSSISPQGPARGPDVAEVRWLAPSQAGLTCPGSCVDLRARPSLPPGRALSTSGPVPGRCAARSREGRVRLRADRSSGAPEVGRQLTPTIGSRRAPGASSGTAGRGRGDRRDPLVRRPERRPRVGLALVGPERHRPLGLGGDRQRRVHARGSPRSPSRRRRAGRGGRRPAGRGRPRRSRASRRSRSRR